MGGKIEKNEMSGVCGAYGAGEKVSEGSGGKPEGKGSLGDPDAGGRIILRWIFRKWEEVVGTGWS